jgi:phosphocarrier protein HPr
LINVVNTKVIGYYKTYNVGGNMKEISVLVIDPVGLHARPATVAVSAASRFKCEVKVAFKGRSVNMKSIMGVMSLGIPTQSEVTISCEGEDEAEAIKTIEDVLRTQKVIQ